MSEIKSPSSKTRRSPRRAFRRPAGLLSGGNYELIHALQISEGGMLVESRARLFAKAKVVVSLIIPGAGPVIARAEVIYIMQSEMGRAVPAFGLQFVDLALPERRLIRNYVAAKTEEEAESEYDFDGEEELSRRTSPAFAPSENKKAA